MTPHDLLEIRVSSIEKEMPMIKSELKINTDLTLSIKADTAGLVEVAQASAGLLRVAKWVGRVIQWLTPVALVLMGLWSAIKNRPL